jgi:hypothetical protein
MRTLSEIRTGDTIVVKLWARTDAERCAVVTVRRSGTWGAVRFLAYYADAGTADLSYAVEADRGTTWCEVQDAIESTWAPGTYSF